jgi:WD40 repeat protein
MLDEPESPEDKRYAELFAAHEEGLHSGQRVAPELSATPTDLEEQLTRDLACAQMLRRVLRPALPPPATSGLPWSSLGRFRIRRELGRGGFGIVFLAHDPLLGREVAVKVPRPEVVVTPELRQRFEREARAVSRLDHPNLVPVFEVGNAGPVCFLVSAYCPGITLAQWLASRKEPVPVPDAARLVATLAEAAGHAHERGIVHRDLKPGNVLLQETNCHHRDTETQRRTKEQEEDSIPSSSLLCASVSLWFNSSFLPRITDFGLARNLIDASSDLQTQTGALVGTPAYMAPEQAAGHARQVGPPADVYALGAILYELLTRRPPFQGDTPLDTLLLVREADPVPPGQLRPKVPRDLETICLKCLQKEPHRRYPSAAALAEDLRRFLTGEQILARPAGLVERLGRWCRRNPPLAVAGSVAAVALVAVVALAVSFALHQNRAAARLLVEQEHTSRAFEKAEKQYALAERRSALLALDRGLTLCDQGSIGRGMLWLTQSLEISARLPGAEAGDLQRQARAHLAAWRGRLVPLRAVLADPRLGAGSLAFSPDGRTIVTGGWDGIARLWESATGKPIDLPRRIDAKGVAVAFSPDGKWILTTVVDNTACLWEIATGKRIGPPLQHPNQVIAVAFRPDGRTVLTGSEDGIARMWEVPDGRPIGPPLVHRGPVRAVAFSPDSKLALTAGDDRTACFWDAATGKQIGLPLLHRGPVQAVAFSPDGKLALTGSDDRTACFWETTSGKPHGEPLRHPDSVLAVAFGPDGKTVLTGCLDWLARHWSVATGKPIGVALPHQTGVGAVAFSPDGRAVLTGGWDEPTRLWEVVPDPPPVPPLEHHDRVRALSFRPDGRVLLTGCQDGKARLWDVVTGRQIGPTFRHKGRVLNVAFSPDGKTVLTGSYDRTAQLWNAVTGIPIGLPLNHEDQVNGMAFSPDGRTVVTCGNRTVRFWEAATGKPLPLPSFQLNRSLEALAWSPNGRSVVTAAGSAVRFWEVATGKPIGQPLTVKGCFRAVAFSPDGLMLLTGSTKNAQLWNVKTGQPIGPPLPHQGSISAVGFSPDGRTMVTGSYDRTARLWEVATGKPIGPPLVHDDEIGDVVFSPDGRTMVTGSYDRTARLWPVPSPVTGEPDRVRLWVEVLTGMELDDEGVISMLDAPTWQQRRGRLRHLGGPPMP